MMTGIYRITAKREEIKGRGLPVFIHNGDNYFSVLMGVYEDGFIDAWGLLNFDEFVEKVKSGWITTSIPEGASISRHHLFCGKAVGIVPWVEEDELIKEVRDVLNSLQGRETSGKKCYDAFELFKTSSGEEERKALRVAYEAVPKHLRKYTLGDMDNKDSFIIKVLYPKDEVNLG